MTQLAKLCAAMMLGRLSLCLPLDLEVLFGNEDRSSAAFYGALASNSGTAPLGFGIMIVCILDLVRCSLGRKDSATTRKAARRALTWILILVIPSAYLGRDALVFLSGEAVDTSNAIRSFARSHIVEWLAGIGVWILLHQSSPESNKNE